MSGRTSAKWGQGVFDYLAKLDGLSWREKAEKLTEKFGFEYRGDQIRKQVAYYREGGQSEPSKQVPLVEQIAVQRVNEEASALRAEKRELMSILAEKEREVEAAIRIATTPQEYTLKTKPAKSLRTTQIIMWSDWHVEEIVNPQSVNHLNEFNERVADARIQSCILNSARLMEITAKDAPVDATILHLGGDFISGNIHTELLENTWARPIDAMIWAQDRLMAGIRHLAARTPKLIIVCNVGNHSRITQKTHFATEQGNSLEKFAYKNMCHALRDLANVEWIIAEGYHVFVDLYGKTIRFHHGHAVKYGGGIGGIFIPAYKAISQWNKARRADLDCFCHFHTLKNGGNFILNGSLIGYNSYAVAIKADFEKPYQKFFLFTNTGEVCGEYPIFLD